ncbi:glycosyltransferase family 2 protein [Paraburkholderia sp. A1RO-5L]|uniref:glycosyltransferase family 2 protein n=1 Tax=unclassified Paraburkholderia TaxID=2615204 RepID=UPI003B7D8D70
MNNDTRDQSLPLVSVVIPCFNQSQYLVESVTSALDAYIGPLEIIIVDDGSTAPRTAADLGRAQELSPLVKVISQANKGLSGARNTGIAAARGEFLQLLDADDLLIPPKIDLQIAHFRVTNALDVSISNFLLCDEARMTFSKHEEAISHSSLDLTDFLYKWERGFAIPIHCALFRRSALAEQPFDPMMHAKEDWLFWCSLSVGGARMAYLNAHNAIYRQHAQSMRRSVLRMGKFWIQATMKIDAMVSKQEPGFFESAFDWFNNFYRTHPVYVEEVAQSRESVETGKVSAEATHAPIAGKVANLLRALAAMPTDAPTISVVIPVYNHFDYIADCLLSAIEERDAAFEIICIDDCSTDTRTTKVLQALEGCHPNLRIVINRQNQGISRVQNQAVELARGEYVAFLDCDDALTPGALAAVSRALMKRPETDYLFTDCFDIDEKGERLRRASYGGYPNIRFSGAQYIKDDLLDGMVASHLKVIRRAAYIKAGGSNESLTGVQDWELALKIAEFGRFQYLPEPLYRHRKHLHSVTSSDSVSQFRKTNIVRRQFAERWLSNGRERTGPLQKYTGKAMPSVDQLKDAWRQGRRCEITVDAQTPAPAFYFLREFNSYFDRIVWRDAETYAALIGYTQPEIMVMQPL